MNTIFVAKTGRDDNPGTLDAPVRTIAQANALAAADLEVTDIVVGPGVYQERIDIPRSGLSYTSQLLWEARINGDGFVINHPRTSVYGFYIYDFNSFAVLFGPDTNNCRVVGNICRSRGWSQEPQGEEPPYVSWRRATLGDQGAANA